MADVHARSEPTTQKQANGRREAEPRFGTTPPEVALAATARRTRKRGRIKMGPADRVGAAGGCVGQQTQK